MTKGVIFFLSLLLCSPFLSLAKKNQAEIQALTSFKLNLHDSLGALNGWDPSTLIAPCDWRGVACSNSRVTELRLSHLQLSVRLSDHLSVKKYQIETQPSYTHETWNLKRSNLAPTKPEMQLTPLAIKHHPFFLHPDYKKNPFGTTLSFSRTKTHSPLSDKTRQKRKEPLFPCCSCQTDTPHSPDESHSHYRVTQPNMPLLKQP